MNDKLRALALNDVLALLDKATPGEWRASLDCRGDRGEYYNAIETPTGVDDVCGMYSISEADCLAIVTCVNFLRTHGAALLAGEDQLVGYMAQCEIDAQRDLRAEGQNAHGGIWAKPTGQAGVPVYTHPHAASAKDAQDAARYRWLKGRLHGADFDYGDDDEKCCVVVFGWPEDGWISADFDAAIDAAMQQTAKEGRS